MVSEFGLKTCFRPNRTVLPSAWLACSGEKSVGSKLMTRSPASTSSARNSSCTDVDGESCACTKALKRSRSCWLFSRNPSAS